MRQKCACPVALAALAALALLGAGCSATDPPAAGAASSGPAGAATPGKDPVPVAVEPVEVGVASSYYTATAVLEAESRAEVLSRANGVVRRLLKEEGDFVKEGEVLLELEDDGPRLEVRRAELELDKARTEHGRRQSMQKARVLSDEDFQTAENELRQAQANLELARLQLSYRRVVAPFGGRVVRRHVDLGAHVQVGTTLYELMDVTPLLARVHVPANRTANIAAGQEIELRLESNDTPLVGRIRLVSPIVDESTGTVKVTAEIPDYPAGTRPGDFAKVRIVTARHSDALMVRSRAILEEKGERIVFVVDGARAARRVVETGFVDGDSTEVVGGLQEGERVLHKGQRGLSDGDPIEVIEAGPDARSRLDGRPGVASAAG